MIPRIEISEVLFASIISVIVFCGLICFAAFLTRKR